MSPRRADSGLPRHAASTQHSGVYALQVDMPHAAAAIPGNGDDLILFTSSGDIARFVEAALGLGKWEQEMNEVVRLAEEARGISLTFAYDGIKMLQQGKMTELPSHTRRYPFLGKKALQKPISTFGLYAVKGDGTNHPVLVSPHWCHGDAMAVYNGSHFASLADKYGFIVIYPDSPNAADKCRDVSSAGTLTHQGQTGDSLGIVSMVAWTIKRYAADACRVFVTGVSSGAMMTNVLLGAYPDVFAAGTAFTGVPFGCFAAPGDGSERDYWSDVCATGEVMHTPAEWRAFVRAAYPGYEGWRPKVQVFHGTADQVLNYTNFGEEENAPYPNWTRYVYGKDGWFEAYSALNVTHDIANHEDVAVAWFDLTCTTGACFRWGQGGPRGPSLLNETPAL
ncbi:Alpha/Beta hydrolase protein [Coniochaeta sp. 2T2.1]|nr:Alpha/Beta hydrolase protein [Coniochaeta sp. 2T2.1]